MGDWVDTQVCFFPLYLFFRTQFLAKRVKVAAMTCPELAEGFLFPLNPRLQRFAPAGNVKVVKSGNQDKVRKLLLAKTKIKKKIEKINRIFEQEKENEEAWPGHAGNVYQLANSDYQVLLNQLSLIESELKKLEGKK